MRRTKTLCLGALFLLLFSANPARATSQQVRPSIILILADDLGWGDVGFNGRNEWKTPRLDDLAHKGMIFNRFYAAAAVCCPSRAAMLTGKYTIHCGVTNNNQDLPSSETTIAEALKPMGYTTGLFGKWHHGSPRAGEPTFVHPMDQGFTTFFGFVDATEAHQKYPKTLWDGRAQTEVKGYADDLFTDGLWNSSKTIAKSPFFLFLSLTASHFRVEAPEEEVRKQTGKFREKDPAHPINANYAAMVARLDHNVGRIIDELAELALTENTLVFFTSDQGATFESGNQGASLYHDSNRPFRGQKRTLWEGGIRVPAFVYWPGKVKPGQKSDAVVHAIDLMPSFVDAAGEPAKRDRQVDGVSMLPIWLGRSHSVEPRTLFWEWRVEGYHQLAAMEGDAKLVVTRGQKELFDVVKDPAERLDRSAIDKVAFERLGKQLNAWLESEYHLP